jgi:hypothetical protein
MGSSLTKKEDLSKCGTRGMEAARVPAPTVSLHDRTVLRCFAAFFTLSPRDRRNRCTHASLQYCACAPPCPEQSLANHHRHRTHDVNEGTFPARTPRTCLAESGACLRSNLRTASIFSLSLESTLSMAMAATLAKTEGSGDGGR